MLGLLFRLERKRRLLRGKITHGNGYYVIGAFVLLASLIFPPLAPAALSAGVGIILLSLACVLTIILAPVGGCLM